MALVEAKEVVIGFGGEPVVSGASFVIQEGEKIGLLGPNGAGKTTILRVISGSCEPEAGAVTLDRPGARRVAYVPQYFPDNFTGTPREYLLSSTLERRRRLAELEESMATAEGKSLERVLSEYGALRELYDQEEGDGAENRAEAVLAEVGLSSVADTPAPVLSGGEKNRLQIGAALISRPDLILLDEPGNHLDAWGLAWLEETLSSYPAATLVVSHNRYLLDRVVTRVLELRRGVVTSWRGNYSAYRSARLRQAVRQAQDARADQKKLDRLEELVARLAQLARAKPDPAVGKRLRARRTQLSKAKEAARERPEIANAKARIGFSTESARANIALELREFTLETPGGEARTLLDSATATIATGERVAIVGPNGCGKTTLLRRIVEEGSWDHDQLRLGPSMRVGYCSQNRELFEPEMSLLDNLQLLGAYSKDRIFALLSRYLFSFDDLERNVGTLSGGELNRLQLARAELLEANFLILDEPTNHLDIESREAVEDALDRFEGTVLLVSHDRYFLDAVAKRILYFDATDLGSFDGGFSDFWFRVGRFLGQADPEEKLGGGLQWAPRKAGLGSGTGSTATPAARQPREPGSAATVEQRLIALESEKVAIERELARAYERAELQKGAALAAKLQKVTALYEKLYAEWG